MTDASGDPIMRETIRAMASLDQPDGDGDAGPVGGDLRVGGPELGDGIGQGRGAATAFAAREAMEIMDHPGSGSDSGAGPSQAGSRLRKK